MKLSMDYTLTSVPTGFTRNEEYSTDFEVNGLVEESPVVAAVTEAADQAIAAIGTSSTFVIPAFLIFGGLHWLLSLLNLLDFIAYFYFTTFALPFNLQATLTTLITVLNTALFPLNIS